jgi:glyoxylase-like metal-dependent hydrolase (beta-lactamase superfamily II)
MNIKQVGKRGFLFTFYELKNSNYDCVTNVYVINGNNHFFICDTYLGPFYMKMIRAYLESNFGKKQYIIFNSHSHWDHIWGNYEFKDCIIISHENCRISIMKDGEEDLNNHHAEFAKEDIKIVTPNITFDNNLIFTEEGIEFFYSPGHSEDSASCYDYVDNTLFVGDNIDDPIPSFICWNELETYKNTLDQYMKIGADIIVQSHGNPMTNDIVMKNKEYLIKLIANEKMNFKSKEVIKKHLINIEYLSQNNK